MITSLIAKCDLLGHINLVPPSELLKGNPFIINSLAGHGVAGELLEGDTSSRRRLRSSSSAVPKRGNSRAKVRAKA